MAVKKGHAAHPHDHAHGHAHEHDHPHDHDHVHDHEDDHDQEDSHGHSHLGHHHHGHHGAIGNIKVAFFMNLGFALLEVFGGLFTNSVAILSDALHDFGDSLALGLAWYLERVSARDSDRAYSYGYARFSVLGAFINSVVLIVGCIFILQSTIPRLLHPEETNAEGMLFFSVIGIAVNGIAAYRLMRGATLNERVVALHLMEDVLGWVAILVGSIVMMFADVPILDPILSIGIMAYVLFNVFRNLGKSFRIFLQGTPAQLNPVKIKDKLKKIEGVSGIHDLHLWTLDGQYHVATLHVVVPSFKGPKEMEEVKHNVRQTLRTFKIEHATIEMEEEGIDCELGECADHPED